MRRLPDVVDCWEYGSITNTGVSDFDIVVVVRDDLPADLGERLRKELLPSVAQDAMAHASLVVVNVSNARDVYYWDNLQVRSLFRDAPVVDRLPPASVPVRRVAMIGTSSSSAATESAS